jgi:outer membrane protein assembly factor BamB
VQWTETDYCWRVKLPGIGHASPVVWGNKVFTFSADPTTAKLYVACHAAEDGRSLWVRDYATTPHRIHDRNTYASSTPTVDAERLYVPWTTPEQLLLRALDHAGQELWTCNLGTWSGDHGFGGSPILHEDLVILHNAQQAEQLEPGQRAGQSSMVAVDRRTGKEVWRTLLTTVRTCFSTPFVRQSSSGEPELICANTGDGIFSLDPKTGKQNWAIKAFDMRVVNSPVEAGGLVFGSNGSGGYSGNYLVAVRPGATPELVYRLKNSSDVKAPYVTCFQAVGNHVFLFYDKGFAGCIEAPTGKVGWFKRTDGAFSGSPVLVRDKIYCIDEEGVVWVIAADAHEYRLLAKNPLGEGSRATPAISGGRMFLRTNSQLFCVGSRNQVAANWLGGCPSASAFAGR